MSFLATMAQLLARLGFLMLYSSLVMAVAWVVTAIAKFLYFYEPRWARPLGTGLTR